MGIPKREVQVPSQQMSDALVQVLSELRELKEKMSDHRTAFDELSQTVRNLGVWVQHLEQRFDGYTEVFGALDERVMKHLKQLKDSVADHNRHLEAQQQEKGVAGSRLCSIEDASPSPPRAHPEPAAVAVLQDVQENDLTASQRTRYLRPAPFA